MSEPETTQRNDIAATLHGTGALAEMLSLIGDTEKGGDQAVARILVESEKDLRALLNFAVGAVRARF
jgi:hypothetical protein